MTVADDTALIAVALDMGADSEQLLDGRDALARLVALLDTRTAALREIINTLGPEYFGGELEGLLAEGAEALRIARAALSEKEET